MGWYGSALGILKAGDVSPTVLTEVTIAGADPILYAVWGTDTNGNDMPDLTENNYILTSHTTGGIEENKAITDLENNTYALDSFAPTHADSDGSSVLFMGWYGSALGILKAGDVSPTVLTEVTIAGADPILYAVWGIDTNGNGDPDIKENTFNVTYVAPNGSAPTDNNEHLAGVLVTVLAPTFWELLFIGWMNSSDGVIYHPGENFTMPADNAVMTAVFASAGEGTKIYYITAIADSGSEISPTGTSTVPRGEGKIYAFAPKEGYHITAVIIDGLHHMPQEIIGSGMYAFSGVMMNHTIKVESAPGSGGGSDKEITGPDEDGDTDDSNGNLLLRIAGIILLLILVCLLIWFLFYNRRTRCP
jgi:hypothetical protein